MKGYPHNLVNVCGIFYDGIFILLEITLSLRLIQYNDYEG